jgi:hypothetical protein
MGNFLSSRFGRHKYRNSKLRHYAPNRGAVAGALDLK